MKLNKETLKKYIQFIKSKTVRKKGCIPGHLFLSIKEHFCELSDSFYNIKNLYRVNKQKYVNIRTYTPLNLYKEDFPFLLAPFICFKNESKEVQEFYEKKAKARNEIFKDFKLKKQRKKY
ncbi:hypothetical protein TUBRATIS_12720 [Tubulinosema ratisbonensis]|uniref:Uncharacterized protein n=1 Tax=Tubulinosema ratisbonensis TaxID=291195 RepID=A0A437AMB2_9MICR|nr:hypothetical protein TUBRATIS_12720 [Tubulinosema ratisbonensis]